MYGVGQVIFGPLSDIYGRRAFLIYALAMFAFFSGICGLAHHFYWLLIGRFFQGSAAAVVSVISKAMLTDKYHNQRLQTASRYKVMAQTMSIIFAPLIGGYVQLWFNWRWTFWLLSIYSLIALILTFYFIPETNKQRSTAKISAVITDFSVICKHRRFVVMTLMVAVLYAMVAFYGLEGPFVVQNELHYSSGIYGLTALLCGCGYLLGSWGSKKFPARLCFAGFLILSLLAIMGLFLIVQLKFINIIAILMPMLIILFSAGLILPHLMRATLNLFRKQAGTASAIFGSFVMLGMSLLLAATGFFVDNLAFWAEFYSIMVVVMILLAIFYHI